MLPLPWESFFGALLTHLYTQDVKAVASLSVVLFLCWEHRLQQERSSIQLFGKVWEMGKLPFYATTIGMWVIRIGAGYLLE